MVRPRREENIAVVGEYLKESFPGDEVLDTDDFDHDSRFYRISRGTVLAHRVRVAHEFLRIRIGCCARPTSPSSGANTRHQAAHPGAVHLAAALHLI
jgi:hypothetical protein